MDITQLLADFADPSKIKDMPFYQLLVGGLFTTLLGMGVTFVALIALQFVAALFGKLSIFKGETQEPVRKSSKPAAKRPPVQSSSALDEEVVAAIAASLAIMLETSASNLRIRSIRRMADPSPAWWRMGILDQTQNRL